MTLEEQIRFFKDHLVKMVSYDRAINMLYYDSVTAMPSGGAGVRATTMGVLNEASYQLKTDPAYQQTLQALYEQKDLLDFQTRREVEEQMYSLKQTTVIPKDEYVAFRVCISNAQQAWTEAKRKNDFALFQPWLEKIFDYKKKYSSLVSLPGAHPYDACLGEHERGISVKQLDPMFANIKSKILPLIQEITHSAYQPREDFLYRSYPIHLQKLLSERLMDYQLYDPKRRAIAETEHPFTIEFSRNDVRITTHYYENNFTSSMFTVMHETGHALYKQNWDESLLHSPLSMVASQGINESQSRFWENMVAHSHAFAEFILPDLKQLFPTQLLGVTTDEFYEAVNCVHPSLIRTRADELTYSLHIMIRYEIEKAVMAGELSVAEMPAVWNRLYKEYLGVEVPDDAHGVLQDVHWSNGYVGGFISYAMGNAYSAQIAAGMRRDLDLDGLIATGQTRPILNWLVEHVHRYGQELTAAEVIQKCGFEAFDPSYYVNYLQKKFSDIYRIG